MQQHIHFSQHPILDCKEISSAVLVFFLLLPLLICINFLYRFISMFFSTNFQFWEQQNVHRREIGAVEWSSTGV